MKHHLNTLFVFTQGTYLRKDSETVMVRSDKKTVVRLPLLKRRSESELRFYDSMDHRSLASINSILVVCARQLFSGLVAGRILGAQVGFLRYDRGCEIELRGNEMRP